MVQSVRETVFLQNRGIDMTDVQKRQNTTVAEPQRRGPAAVPLHLR